MNGPAWPGQQQPGPPPGYPPVPPPGYPSAPPPLPPPRGGGNGGVLIMLLVFGVVVVLAIAAIGAFLVVRSDDDTPPDTIEVPRPTATATPTDAPTRASSSDPYSILGGTVETAKGNTFTRAGTRTESCVGRANTELKAVLADHPCAGDMHSAVYADPTKKIITTVSILDFATAADAEAVKEATTGDAWPELLTPSENSGLPQPGSEPSYWTRTWAMDDRVVYAQSYRTDGSSPGDRGGDVYATAGELGVEITNVLRFTN
ncbi:hypothetical protein BJF79_47580 [Actinomadura sp. CNU-125]|uniref:hypothetical protein n=1 Tax=Actinomadura sp. CNU-125 TaxID=1904961 RepID=UPI0009624388|nr:hypothetical protein [Actinomadura sp. CNU-125]OLT19899.1 hypothetical protein BJF79_47580 [Actinomadura sp. CNU-125]